MARTTDAGWTDVGSAAPSEIDPLRISDDDPTATCASFGERALRRYSASSSTSKTTSGRVCVSLVRFQASREPELIERILARRREPGGEDAPAASLGARAPPKPEHTSAARMVLNPWAAPFCRREQHSALTEWPLRAPLPVGQGGSRFLSAHSGNAPRCASESGTGRSSRR
jgi:hypothetical protein